MEGFILGAMALLFTAAHVDSAGWDSSSYERYCRINRNIEVLVTESECRALRRGDAILVEEYDINRMIKNYRYVPRHGRY